MYEPVQPNQASHTYENRKGLSKQSRSTEMAYNHRRTRMSPPQIALCGNYPDTHFRVGGSPYMDYRGVETYRKEPTKVNSARERVYSSNSPTQLGDRNSQVGNTTLPDNALTTAAFELDAGDVPPNHFAQNGDGKSNSQEYSIPKFKHTASPPALASPPSISRSSSFFSSSSVSSTTTELNRKIAFLRREAQERDLELERLRQELSARAALRTMFQGLAELFTPATLTSTTKKTDFSSFSNCVKKEAPWLEEYLSNLSTIADYAPETGPDGRKRCKVGQPPNEAKVLRASDGDDLGKQMCAKHAKEKTFKENKDIFEQNKDSSDKKRFGEWSPWKCSK
ncbi:hypothetical protein BCR34DRAFT_594429 [Clohesyomyces aquaticus]|uniref:Uncharacterized protein n=1 Tax=Clohesyomyces aquaticus TaxID=1231657 RepID=A0A1Y1Y9K8_9PLEO|nr:hypothetical protein BCR34DRAFT_594429 [Clohesyomyces aquaticus]